MVPQGDAKEAEKGRLSLVSLRTAGADNTGSCYRKERFYNSKWGGPISSGSGSRAEEAAREETATACLREHGDKSLRPTP